MSESETLLCVDPVVPISKVISRMEKHYDELVDASARTSWWQFKRRWVFAGACAAYRNEINALLSLGASCQPVIGKMMRNRQA